MARSARNTLKLVRTDRSCTAPIWECSRMPCLPKYPPYQTASITTGSQSLSRARKFSTPPSTLDTLDLIEFCWKNVGNPIESNYHSFFQHNHLKFDIEAGRSEFQADVNTIFRRNGIAYELTELGRIERLVPTAFRDMLRQRDLNTGDVELDRLLDAAQSKFLDPRPASRQEMLEALWDAWERLKTLDGPGDKKARATAMLDRAAGETSPKFRDVLEKEATNLTRIGNNLRIRHSEVDKELMASKEHADYLFYRLYSLIRLVIRSRQNPCPSAPATTPPPAPVSPPPPNPPPSSSAARPAPATPPAWGSTPCLG